MRLVGTCLIGILLATAVNTARAEKVWTVDFRLQQWKSMHFNSAKQANAHFEIVTKLGCEAKKFAHGGHTDVKYRCPRWKQMKLASDEEAHRWVRWLKNVGFETRHQH